MQYLRRPRPLLLLNLFLRLQPLLSPSRTWQPTHIQRHPPEAIATQPHTIVPNSATRLQREEELVTAGATADAYAAYISTSNNHNSHLLALKGAIYVNAANKQSGQQPSILFNTSRQRLQERLAAVVGLKVEGLSEDGAVARDSAQIVVIISFYNSSLNSLVPRVDHFIMRDRGLSFAFALERVINPSASAKKTLTEYVAIFVSYAIDAPMAATSHEDSPSYFSCVMLLYRSVQDVDDDELDGMDD
ncbi:hypothetical protein CKAH01_18909 [Colletotrichum kahawae]|uniref:Uncharacterized protein n=1 Tax=Colletotrichum kahawae TaxID=34407 RepID=A0AAD9Y398_COLKA|nr:hypothetical protein CKAH01_18909 [Colletotrichum kahawae]